LVLLALALWTRPSLVVAVAVGAGLHGHGCSEAPNVGVGFRMNAEMRLGGFEPPTRGLEDGGSAELAGLEGRARQTPLAVQALGALRHRLDRALEALSVPRAFFPDRSPPCSDEGVDEGRVSLVRLLGDVAGRPEKSW
jgi:hypothetical protein